MKKKKKKFYDPTEIESRIKPQKCLSLATETEKKRSKKLGRLAEEVSPLRIRASPLPPMGIAETSGGEEESRTSREPYLPPSSAPKFFGPLRRRRCNTHLLHRTGPQLVVARLPLRGPPKTR